MTLLDRVRAALEGWGNVREAEMFGGLVFDWDGDPLVGVVDGELIVRAEGGGWETVTGDLDELIGNSARIVLAECVVRWHAQLSAGGFEASRALLALVHHDEEREQLQRLLLDLTRPGHELRQLAVTCLGHVGRLDGVVLPEVVPRLQELLADPEVGGTAEDALWDVEVHIHPFMLWRQTTPSVIFTPPGDEEVARQLPLADAAGSSVVVIPHAETRPSLIPFVKDLCREVEKRTCSVDEDGDLMPDPTKPAVYFVLEYDGDIAALQPALDDDDHTARFTAPYLLVW